MVRRKFLLLFPWLMVLALTAGCASHKAYVLARRDASFSPTLAARIAMVNQLKPRPEDQELSVVLTAELKRQGFHLVPQEEAEYTLSYWIEENWHQRKVPVKTYDPLGQGPYFTSGALPPASLEYGMAVSGGPVYPSPKDGRVTVILVDDPVAVQGIRLQLYSCESARAGRLQTAWEGYIDAGFKVAPERAPILLRTLLTYFGKDYTGRARLVE